MSGAEDNSKVYYGWVNLALAAAAMIGNWPGRTQGLGLVTEPRLRDLRIDRVSFAQINLVATLVGSLFCLGVGRLVDRLGSRVAATQASGWRVAWSGIGMALVFGLAPLAWLFVRSTPESCGLEVDGGNSPLEPTRAQDEGGATLSQALRTPAFWVFALASAVYGLVASVLSHVRTQGDVMAYAVVMGLAGGSLIVAFFTFWGRSCGRTHLGRIQGAAQILTVLASAVGPLLLAECVAIMGAYATAFYTMAGVVAALGVAAAIVPEPSWRA